MALSVLELLGGLNYPVLWQLPAYTAQNKILNLTGGSVTTAGWFEFQFLYGLIIDL